MNYWAALCFGLNTFESVWFSEGHSLLPPVGCFSALNEPHGALADWRGSTLVPGATNWHVSPVCRKPPARHTCYMYVAKERHFRTPATRGVSGAVRPSVGLCFHARFLTYPKLRPGACR